jgi:hypothetical protein
MVSRLLSWLILVSLTFSGCSSGGGAQQTVLPQSHEIQGAPITQQTETLVSANAVLPSATTHFLYAAAFDRVNIYTLPLTSTSTPLHHITGFVDAAGVQVGSNNINVIDVQSSANGLVIFFASGANALMKRCSVSFNAAPFAIDVHDRELYLAFNTLGFVSQFANLPTGGTPGPCTGEKPVNDGNGLTNPQAVAADNHFVYVGAQ